MGFPKYQVLGFEDLYGTQQPLALLKFLMESCLAYLGIASGIGRF